MIYRRGAVWLEQERVLRKGNLLVMISVPLKMRHGLHQLQKKATKYSYEIETKNDFPFPGTPKYKMMVLSGEIKE